MTKEESFLKNSYPIILTPDAGGYVVEIPDFAIGTQGDSIPEAMEMARDAIGLMGIDMEDDGKSLPIPSTLESVSKGQGDIVTLVDVDFTEYRRQNDMRSVRRNVSLPCWLNAAAEKAGINVSAVLQAALKQQLHLET